MMESPLLSSTGSQVLNNNNIEILLLRICVNIFDFRVTASPFPIACMDYPLID